MSKFLAAIIAMCISISSGTAQERIIYNLVQGLPFIFISPESERIGGTWCEGNVWDKALIRNFYSLLADHKGHFVMLDVGAQTGSFSLLAKFFPNSQWYAFEPLQEAADVLKTNLQLNKIENVSVYQMAVSNISGRAMLKMPGMNEWGLCTLGHNVQRFSPVIERRLVKCIDLDSFVAKNKVEKVDFIKIDTEGWEYFILQGAKNLILRDHPIILMEHNETNMKQCLVSKEKIEEFLKAMGYEWELISTEDILCIPAVN